MLKTKHFLMIGMVIVSVTLLLSCADKKKSGGYQSKAVLAGEELAKWNERQLKVRQMDSIKNIFEDKSVEDMLGLMSLLREEYNSNYFTDPEKAWKVLNEYDDCFYALFNKVIDTLITEYHKLNVGFGYLARHTDSTIRKAYPFKSSSMIVL